MEKLEKLTVRTREAAQMLSVSERHLADLIRRGEIPRVKSGSANLIMVDDIRAWLEKRKEVANG